MCAARARGHARAVTRVCAGDLPSILAKGWTDAYDNTKSYVFDFPRFLFPAHLNLLCSWIQLTYRDLMLPPAQKLLPDQLQPMPVLVIGLEVPPPYFPAKISPAPHTSLKDCMMHTEWTREHGHRHLKRPGMEAFLACVRVG